MSGRTKSLRASGDVGAARNARKLDGTAGPRGLGATGSRDLRGAMSEARTPTNRQHPNPGQKATKRIEGSRARSRSSQQAGSVAAADDAETFQPQELVVTLLGTYVRSNPRELWSGGLVQLLGEFGFTTAAARVALSRLVQRGLLARVKKGRHVYYTVTERTEHLLVEGDRRIFPLGSHEEWDGSWTILWHAIPQDRRVERGRLAKRLRFLGFGSVQDGTWIAPRDRASEVTDLLHELGVDEFASVFLGRLAPGLHLETLIARAWNLSELDARYAAFADTFAHEQRAARKRNLTDRDAFIIRTRVIHWFRQFPFLDPEFPDDVMPSATNRRIAVEVFWDLYKALAEASQRYFDSQTSRLIAEPSSGTRRSRNQSVT